MKLLRFLLPEKQGVSLFPSIFINHSLLKSGADILSHLFDALTRELFNTAGINADHLHLLKTHFTPDHVKNVLKKCREALEQKKQNNRGKFFEIPENYEEIEIAHKELSQLKEVGRMLSKYSSSAEPKTSNPKAKAKRKRNKQRASERKIKETAASLPQDVKIAEPQNTRKEPTYELTDTPIEILQKEKISEEKASTGAKFTFKDSAIQMRFEVAKEAIQKIQQILTCFDNVIEEEGLNLLAANALSYYMMVFFESLHSTSEIADHKTKEASSIASTYLIDRSIATHYRNALRHFKDSSKEIKVVNLARRLKATNLDAALSSLLSGQLEIGRGKPITEFEFKGYKIKEEKGERNQAIAEEIRKELSQIEISLANLEKSELHMTIAKAAILKAISDMSAAMQNLSAQKWEKLRKDAPLLIKLQKNGNRLSHKFSINEGLSFSETAWKSISSLLKKLKVIKKQTEMID